MENPKLIPDETYDAGDFQVIYNEIYNEITIRKRNGEQLFVIPVTSNVINVE